MAAFKVFNRAIKEGQLASAPPINLDRLQDAFTVAETFGSDLTAGINALPATDDRMGTKPIDAQQHDAGTPDVLLRCVPIRDQGLQPKAIRGGEREGDATAHPARLAGYTGDRAAEAAKAHGIALEVVRLPEAKRGFVLLPRRWVVERSFAWATRCRRLVKDYEGYASTLAGLHMVAFVCLMLKRAETLMISS